jgi:Tol biopolymer transport system component
MLVVVVPFALICLVNGCATPTQPNQQTLQQPTAVASLHPYPLPATATPAPTQPNQQNSQQPTAVASLAAYPLPAKVTPAPTRAILTPAPTQTPLVPPTKDPALVHTPTPIRPTPTPAPTIRGDMRITKEIQITKDGKSVFHTWSPDSTKILFSNPSGWWVANADGSQALLLASNSGHMIFSPNGKRIAYLTINDNRNEIWLMDSDGNNKRQMITLYKPDPKSANVGQLEWLNEKTLLFEHNQRMQSLEIDTASKTQLPNWVLDVDPFTSFRISAQGRQLALRFGKVLAIGNTDGTGYIQITNKLMPPEFQWSPDGNWLAYLTDDNNGELWVADQSGSTKRRIAAIPYMQNIIWSPDGNSLAYLAWNATEVWVVARADGNPRQIVSDASRLRNGISWSPFGSHITYVQQYKDPARLLATYINGGGTFQLGDKTGWYSHFPPQWSPAGNQIAFTRAPFDATDSYDVWVATVQFP